MNNIEKWFEINRLRMNINKTNLIHFHTYKNQINIEVEEFELNFTDKI